METSAAKATRDSLDPSQWFFIVVPLVVVAMLAWAGWHAPWTALRIAGLVVMAAGLVLVSVARITLGSSFSVLPEARKLVTRGIYSKIRNPVYFFAGVAVPGAAAWFMRPEVLLLLVPMVPLQLVRARAEAKVLEAKFGDEYRQYRAKTWF